MVRRTVLVLCLIGILVAATAPAALAEIEITRIQYDPPGTDSGSNSHLNKEFIVLENTGNNAVSLKGWVLKDQSGHRYTFGSFRLRSGRSVTIHTGSGNDDANDLYQGSDEYIWNNDGDKATLRDDSDDSVDTCRYTGGEAAVIC